MRLEESLLVFVSSAADSEEEMFKQRLGVASPYTYAQRY
jgi:hypothetical protein